MAKTRAKRRAAAERQLLELPADVLSLVLYQLPLAHDISLAGLTCRQLCDAAKRALKLRPFSGEVVALGGHNSLVHGVSVAPDARRRRLGACGASRRRAPGAAASAAPQLESLRLAARDRRIEQWR